MGDESAVQKRLPEKKRYQKRERSLVSCVHGFFLRTVTRDGQFARAAEFSNPRQNTTVMRAPKNQLQFHAR